MSESLVGRKVRLTGEDFDRYTLARTGRAYTIIVDHFDLDKSVGIERPTDDGILWVWLDGGRYGGVLVEPAPDTVTSQQKGYLDGWLGLEPSSPDDGTVPPWDRERRS
jgi:hypothetical protein